MWFNPHEVLSQIETPLPAILAISANPAPQIAKIVGIADRDIQKQKLKNHIATPLFEGDGAVSTPETYAHGLSFTGKPKTWTGGIVSLDAWRSLTDWEKHGPNGRHWNGITQTWEQPK
jgi:hypothetical protein